MINVANLSFPDAHTNSSNSDTATAKYVFRFRAQYPTFSETEEVSQLTQMSFAHRSTSHPYLFGYVFFLQRPDKSIERGFFQKSIVIITPVPYVHVFIKCAEVVGDFFFNHGSKILESACRNICSWPLPIIEGDVALPILGDVIRVYISPKSVPPSHSLISLAERMSLKKNMHSKNINRQPRKHRPPKHHPPTPPSSLKNKRSMMKNLNSLKDGTLGAQLVDRWSAHPHGGCFQEVNLYRYFRFMLGNLWFLWELALTGKPMLVIATTAEECSYGVLGIMSLISPMTYCGDFRPYFTIYDHDFKHFCDLHDHDMLPPLMLGVTNPFFLKVMPKYPHILVLSSSNSHLISANNNNNSSNNTQHETSASPSSSNSNSTRI
jgi:hypothetical protein